MRNDRQRTSEDARGAQSGYGSTHNQDVRIWNNSTYERPDLEDEEYTSERPFHIVGGVDLCVEDLEG